MSVIFNFSESRSHWLKRHACRERRLASDLREYFKDQANRVADSLEQVDDPTPAITDQIFRVDDEHALLMESIRSPISNSMAIAADEMLERVNRKTRRSILEVLSTADVNCLVMVLKSLKKLLEEHKESQMEFTQLINEYSTGPELLREAITGMSAKEINTASVPGKWSTRQVVCHLADFEPVYADRMKHVIAEDQPSFAGGFHQQFADHLAYNKRDIQEELKLIEAVRNQMARILYTLPPEVFERTGIHSVEGPMTLGELLKRITNHIPHHVQFIEDKRRAMLT